MSLKISDVDKCGCPHSLSDHTRHYGDTTKLRCTAPSCMCGWSEEDFEDMQGEDLQKAIAGMATKDEDKSKDKVEEPTCTRCGATEKVRKLTGIINGRMVPLGSPGSHAECYDLGECKKSGWEEHKGGWGEYTVFKCRHEAIEAFSIGGISFYGGSETKVQDQVFDPEEWLVVSLLGSAKKEHVWTRNKAWTQALSRYDGGTSIVIDWSDMSAPPVRYGFWAALYALAKKEKFKNVLFYCIGGHGRTGTALSSTLIECADMSAKDAVDLVRKTYCKEAVESKSQAEYLNLLRKIHLSRIEKTKTRKGREV